MYLERRDERMSICELWTEWHTVRPSRALIVAIHAIIGHTTELRGLSLFSDVGERVSSMVRRPKYRLPHKVM